MRDPLAAWLICCGLFALAWAAVGESAERDAKRRAARTPAPERREEPGPESYNCRCTLLPAEPPMPVISYWAAEAKVHPCGHLVLHVDTTSADEAWAAISRRRA